MIIHDDLYTIKVCRYWSIGDSQVFPGDMCGQSIDNRYNSDFSVIND